MYHKLNLRESRNFDQVFNATLLFIKQNFKPLLTCLLVFATPLLLVSVGLQMYYFPDFIISQTQIGNEVFTYLEIFSNTPFIIASFLKFFSGVLAFLTVYGYMAAYIEDEYRAITPKMVWGHIASKIFFSFVCSIILTVLSIIGLSLFIIPGIYFGTIFLLAYPIIAFERTNFGGLLSRCFFLIKDNWWSTFILLFVFTILFVLTVSIVTNLEFLLFHNITNSVFRFIYSTITLIFVQFLYSIVATALGFQYFNLVQQTKDTAVLVEVEQMDDYRN